VATHLGSLRDEVVFVGGMVTGLLVTDPGAAMARPTDDIDLIVEVASTVEYQTRLRDRLIAQGFRESVEDDVVCRWRLGELVVDVMPATPGVLGFANPWYPHALATASEMVLPPREGGHVSIRVISAPAFLATKLVAWEGRGNGDLLHPDIEDVVAVVNGRRELSGEVERDAPELRTFLAEAIERLFAMGLEEALPGHLEGDAASQARMPLGRS
jgi:predicted nucleotidyltransferase